MDALSTQSLQLRTEIEFAYLAGIIDGEGTIGIYLSTTKSGTGRTRSFFPTTIIVQRDPLLPKWIHANFGGSISHRVYRIRGFKRDKYTYWRWYITGKKTGDFLRTVRPYLRLKGEQADCAIALSETILAGGKTWLYPDGQTITKAGLPGRPNAKPADLIAYQESLYHRCKLLNSPPVVEGEPS